MKKIFKLDFSDVIKHNNVLLNCLPLVILVVFIFEGFFGLSEFTFMDDFFNVDGIKTAGNIVKIPVILTSNTQEVLFDFEIVARWVGCGLATAGLGGVGTGIGMVFSGLIEGLSRNPSVKDDLFSYAIFGFALTEAIGLFSLMIAFMLLYA